LISDKTLHVSAYVSQFQFCWVVGRLAVLFAVV
jgi:hypothetical protein